MKTTILKKLNLTERGALLILSNEALCERIFNETPIHSLEFKKKYHLSYKFINKLIDNNFISSFSNTNKKGSKIFIFEEEACVFVGENLYKHSFFPQVNKALELYLALAKNILAKNDYYILEGVLLKKKSIKEILEDTKTERQAIKNTINRVMNLFENYLSNMIQYETLQTELIKLREEERELKNIIDRHYNIIKEDHITVVENFGFLATKIIDCDLSVRVFNCLRRIDIITVGDLINLDINYLKKNRDLGKKSINEIEVFLAKNGLKLKN